MEKTKFIFVHKQAFLPVEKCEDISSAYKQRADELFQKIVSKCPSAEHITNALGRLVLVAIPSSELDAEQLAEEFNCTIYKKIAG